MKYNKLTLKETETIANRQIFALENGYTKGLYSLDDIGDLVPGAITVQNVESRQVTFMNDWGCEMLNHSMDEINDMGSKYFDTFFLPEQSSNFLKGMVDYVQREDTSSLYSFFHLVRTGKDMKLSWYYAVCKFLRKDTSDGISKNVILIANPVSGMGLMVNKINKVLEENLYVAKNYRQFAALTKREKEVLKLLAEGRKSAEISDLLFISQHTVQTHRKSIKKKTELRSFAELVRFAIAFELIC